jgi:hypothetical protein
MGTASTETLNKLRGKFLSESLSNEGTLRYGLFSSPLAGVSGSGNYDFQKQKKVGPDNKVLTQPRGIFPGAEKTGKTAKSYFSDVGYTTIGDPYIDPSSVERKYQLSKKGKNPHDTKFKPADGFKTDPTKSLFEHKAEFDVSRKDHRGPDGKVKLEPRNICASPSKKYFGKSPEYLKDEYDRRRELDYQEHQENKKKLQEQPFKSAHPGNRPFFNDKKTFFIEQPKPSSSPNIESKKQIKYHDAPFKPSSNPKSGFNGGLNPFPEYKANPIHIAVRKADPAIKKDPFKPNNTAEYNRPTPSVSLNKINLKNEMIRNSSSLL